MVKGEDPERVLPFLLKGGRGCPPFCYVRTDAAQPNGPQNFSLTANWKLRCGSLPK